ncbi:hypothetical protein [Scopulibacillus cellulosilyticus]|uniref:Uncharacterized protein n=1 Tax=Scopulibacillus cellulosilyticus TaxID=2665665 RepID=A0ABW2Q118_9BACL
MLIIKGKEVKFDTMKNNTGAFFGETFIPTWNGHFKENLNVTSISLPSYSSPTMGSINIINDNDGLDYIGTTSDFTIENK